MSCPGCKHEFKDVNEHEVDDDYADLSFGLVSFIVGVATLCFIIGFILVQYSGV